ncbi:MAG TPA: cache domain-containing protein, partial [Anaerolineales bacterium]|nr:cache domain-containing protein [Anaerolineales bacterium]
MGLKLTPRLALVFILFALAISAGVGILAYYSGRLSLEAAAKTELQSTALEKEAALEAWIFERESSISALARSGYILEQLVEFRESEHNSRQAHDRLIRELSVHTGPGQAFLTLFILAPEDGRVIASVDSGEEGDLRTNLAYFIEGKSGIYTTPIYYSPDLLVPAMTTAAPLYSAEGKLLGVLAGRLNLEELNAIIQRRSALRETDDAFLVNRENQFVTQPRFIPDPAVLKVGVHTELVQRCLAGDSNTMSAVDYRGVPVIAVYRWLSTRQMCLIVKISQAETLAPVERFGTRVIGIALGTLVAASVAALLLSNALLRPIRAMQVAAKRYG